MFLVGMAGVDFRILLRNSDADQTDGKSIPLQIRSCQLPGCRTGCNRCIRQHFQPDTQRFGGSEQAFIPLAGFCPANPRVVADPLQRVLLLRHHRDLLRLNSLFPDSLNRQCSVARMFKNPHNQYRHLSFLLLKRY
ncbi:hypothetical protein D3C73_854550 [compost metagenome]